MHSSLTSASLVTLLQPATVGQRRLQSYPFVSYGPCCLTFMWMFNTRLATTVTTSLFVTPAATSQLKCTFCFCRSLFLFLCFLQHARQRGKQTNCGLQNIWFEWVLVGRIRRQRLRVSICWARRHVRSGLKSHRRRPCKSLKPSSSKVSLTLFRFREGKQILKSSLNPMGLGKEEFSWQTGGFNTLAGQTVTWNAMTKRLSDFFGTVVISWCDNIYIKASLSRKHQHPNMLFPQKAHACSESRFRTEQ